MTPTGPAGPKLMGGRQAATRSDDASIEPLAPGRHFWLVEVSPPRWHTCCGFIPAGRFDPRVFLSMLRVPLPIATRCMLTTFTAWLEH